MDEQVRLAAARMATDLTIALLNDKSGKRSRFRHTAGLPSTSGLLPVFDEVYQHLLRSLQPAPEQH